MKKVFYVVFASLVILLTMNTISPVYAQTGEALYEKKCGRCHTAFSPDSFAAEEWAGIVRSMKAQAALTDQEIDEIVSYLESAAGGSHTESYVGHPVLGGYLYTEYFKTQEKTKNFDIHYLAFFVNGWAKENIYYFAEFELEHGGTGGNNTFVEQAYLDYWFNSNVALKIGSILTPFNRFDELHAPLQNFTITRPQMAREIGVSAWKDVGVDFHGFFTINEKASMSFDLYAINGLGAGSNLRGSRQYRDNNENLSYGARANVIYGDFLEVGGSGYIGPWDDVGDYNLTMLGGHVMAKTRFADFYGEYSSATSENPPVYGDGDISGYFLQASKLINNRFRPTVRYGTLDYLDMGDGLGRSASKGDKDLSELVLTFGIYPTDKVVFKFEYQFMFEGDRKTEKDNNVFGIQTAVQF